MNLFYISQSEIPSRSANSIHVMKMCSSFAKHKKMKVDLFCLQPLYEDLSVSDIYKFYLVKKNFNILKLKVSNNWIFRELKSLIFILYCISKKKYDLIYSRSIQFSWFLSIFGIKTILEVHSPPSPKTKKILSILLRKNKILKLIVINNKLKSYFTSNFHIHQNLEISVYPDASDELVIEKKKN